MEKKINLGNAPFTIAFSGGCFSGKTSTMQALKSILEKEGYKVVIIDENIRKTEKAKKCSDSIDALRANPDSYFELQKEIIQEKIKQENEAFNSKKPNVYLFDRALTDSLFYYEFYVDKSKLAHKDDYFNFHKWLIDNIFNSMYHLDLLVEFKPLLGIHTDDKMRPANLGIASSSEFLAIHRNNVAFYNELLRNANKGFLQIDLNKIESNNCIEQIINKIQKVCKLQKR